MFSLQTVTLNIHIFNGFMFMLIFLLPDTKMDKATTGSDLPQLSWNDLR